MSADESHRAPSSLIALTVLSGLGVLVLVSLGVWQIQRLHWKENLLADIDARAKTAPMSLAAALQTFAKTGDAAHYKVTFKGRFLNGRERHLYTVLDGVAGWRIIVPVVSGTRLVMVDRGIVPEQLKAQSTRKQGLIDGEVAITGVVRQVRPPNLFTPGNDPSANTWYWRDLDAMAKGARAGADGDRTLVPFLVEATAPKAPGGWPQTNVTKPNISNRHLGYALTWFGLATGLAAVFGSYIRQRLKARDSQ